MPWRPLAARPGPLGSRQEMLRLQIGHRDRFGLFSADSNPRVELLQRFKGQCREHLVERRADRRMGIEHRLADDRGRGVDDLRAFIVAQRDESERGKLADTQLQETNNDPMCPDVDRQ